MGETGPKAQPPLSKEVSRAAQMDRRDKPNPKPALLDVVQIDGMWAQVLPSREQIKFLGDLAEGTDEAVDINWDEMDFEPYFSNDTTDVSGGSVLDLLKNQEITNEEYWAVRWGPEQEQHPQLRQQVHVFGKYFSKKI